MARHLLLTSSEGGPAQELGGVSTLALFIAPSPQPSALTLLHTRCAASEKSQDQLSQVRDGADVTPGEPK